MEKAIKYFLFLLILSVFWIPLFVQHFPLVSEKKLDGYFQIPDSDFVLNDTNWISGEFQDKYEKWYNYNMGLHRTGVRLNNQINFWAKEQPYGVVLGKENELMELPNITAYLGKDFVGRDSIERECIRLRAVTDSLASYGIKFFIVIAPNKVRIRPQYLPDFFHPEKRQAGNYEYYLEGFKKHNIPFIDFNKWFELIKDTSRYPIFSNFGVHWGNYGAMLCSDSLLRCIETSVGKEINRPQLKEVFFSDTAEGTDYDLAHLLNLMYPLKPRDKFVAFRSAFIRDTSKFFPDVMVVGDSYYWSIMNWGIPKLFSPEFRYIYYNSTVFYNDGNSKPVKELNLKEEVLAEKVVFFLYTEFNLQHLANGFTENLLAALSKHEDPKRSLAHKSIYKLEFEEIPKQDNHFIYSSDVAKSGKHSILLNTKNPYSPSIVLSGEELLQDTSKGKRMASVQFYYKEGLIDPGEAILVTSIESSSGIYYYKDVHFNTVFPKINKWNSISIEIPVNEIKAKSDQLKIFVWSPQVHRKIYIDNLQYEIVLSNPQ